DRLVPGPDGDPDRGAGMAGGPGLRGFDPAHGRQGVPTRCPVRLPDPVRGCGPGQSESALSRSSSATSGPDTADGAATVIDSPAGSPRKPVTTAPASSAIRPPAATSHGFSPRSE